VKLVITGFASLDYAVRLDRPSQADRTATILSRPTEWPRLGGSPAYVAAALAAEGAADATPVTWIGDDGDGETYLAALVARGLSVAGVGRRPGRTPICILAYEPAGGCHCLYDPGLQAPAELDSAQRALIAAADGLCLTIGPPEATREALRLARPDAKVVWAVKADRRAAPPDLAAELAARADLIVHSRGEAPFVAEALSSSSATRDFLRIETRGGDGVAAYLGEVEQVFAVEPVDCDDTTGAGDTFLGGFLAAYLARGESSARAVETGARAARQLLGARVVARKG